MSETVFAPNGSSPPENDVSSEWRPPEHGYPNGPRSALGLFGAMRMALTAKIGSEILTLLVVAGYLLAPDNLPDFFHSIGGTELNAGALVDFIYVVSALVAFFFVARFSYRTMRNLHTIHSPSAEMTPGWTVGWYFIPIASLWKPAKGMSEIYHGTHEAVGETRRDSSPIPLWWLCYLLAGLPSWFAQMPSTTPFSAFLLYAVSAALGISASVMLIRMGRAIAVRQETLMHGGISNVFA